MSFVSNDPFDPITLADDLCEVQRIYVAFFSGLSQGDWDRSVKGGPKEWNLRETVAHLCALNGAGLESIRSTLLGKSYTFSGLTDRYQFHAYNRSGIDDHLALPVNWLSSRLLDILGESADIARQLSPEQAQAASEMPIYNRPVKIIEALSIIMFHTGLHHSAQVAEPAGVSPLWQHLSPDIRHRTIGRVMRALSLLYRKDLGGDLRAVFAFRVGGPGGGDWYVQVTPGIADSGSGPVERASLTFNLRTTDIFCQMFTGRINLPLALLGGRLKLRGDLRLFPKFGKMFSVDAHP
jgi:hypothetical protein